MASYRTLPLWAWVSIISAIISLALLAADSHWFWSLLFILPGLIILFPAFRWRFIAEPWLKKLADYANNNEYTHAADNDSLMASWLSNITIGSLPTKLQTESPNSDAERTKPSTPELSYSEIKAIDGLLSLLHKIADKYRAEQKNSAKVNHTENNSINARELIAAEPGLGGLRIDKSYGGRELSLAALSKLILKLIQGNNGEIARLLIRINSGVPALVANFGSPKQKEKLLPTIAKGETICFAMGPANSQLAGFYAVIEGKDDELSDNSKPTNNMHKGIRVKLSEDDYKLPSFYADCDLLAIFMPVYSSLQETIPACFCWALVRPKEFKNIPPKGVHISKEYIIQSDKNGKRFLLSHISKEQSRLLFAYAGAQSLIQAQISSALVAVYITMQKAKDFPLLIENCAKQCQAGLLSKEVAVLYRDISYVNNSKLRYKEYSEISYLMDEILQNIRNINLNGIKHKTKPISKAQDEENYELSHTPNLQGILMSRNPYWANMLAAAKSQTDIKSQLRAVDYGLGHYIGSSLNSLLLSFNNGINGLDYINILAVYSKKISSLLAKYTNSSKRPIKAENNDRGLNRTFALKRRWNHLSAATAFIMQTWFIVSVIKHSSFDNNIGTDSIKALSPIDLLSSIFALNSILISAEYIRDENNLAAQSSSLSHWRNYAHTCAKELKSFIYKLPLSVPITRTLLLLSLTVNRDYNHKKEEEDYEISEIWSIPSKERAAFFDTLDKEENLYKKIEETVLLSWLVKEIFDKLPARYQTRPSKLSHKEWSAQLLKKELINEKDLKIIKDFYKNTYFITNIILK